MFYHISALSESAISGHCNRLQTFPIWCITPDAFSSFCIVDCEKVCNLVKMPLISNFFQKVLGILN